MRETHRRSRPAGHPPGAGPEPWPRRPDPTRTFSPARGRGLPDALDDAVVEDILDDQEDTQLE